MLPAAFGESNPYGGDCHLSYWYCSVLKAQFLFLYKKNPIGKIRKVGAHRFEHVAVAHTPIAVFDKLGNAIYSFLLTQGWCQHWQLVHQQTASDSKGIGFNPWKNTRRTVRGSLWQRKKRATARTRSNRLASTC